MRKEMLDISPNVRENFPVQAAKFIFQPDEQRSFERYSRLRSSFEGVFCQLRRS